MLVQLGTAGGEGVVVTYNGEGQELVQLGPTPNGEGFVRTFNGEGEALVVISTIEGVGVVGAFDPSGRREASILGPE